MRKNKRLFILASLCVLAFCIIILRLFYLQVVQHKFYEKISLEQRKRIIKLSAQRGDILDRNGNLLAVTIDTYSVFSDLNHSFNWLARKISLPEAEKMKAKDPVHTGILKEKKRVYPKNNFAAQLLGFVGLDNEGLSGVELSFDEYLRGKEGQVVTEGDPQGREMYGAFREIQPGSDGMNVTLTIDENIQYMAEREIAEQVRKYSAVSGTFIVMDAKTGEILALASKPDFDPNNYRKANAKLWHPRFLDPYEPGSTFKLISVAAGLEQGVINKDSRLQALNSIIIGGKKIENSHQIAWKGSDATISYVLEQSINTGVAQIGLKLGPQKLYDRIKAFDFGKRTNFGLYGESKGIVRHYQDWYASDVGMITFGQGIAVTPMQLLAAVSAFANRGQMVKPIIIKKIESIDGKFVKSYNQYDHPRAVSDKVADEMKKLMHNVVLHGSGKKAQIAGFQVGGKTGTAQKAVPGGIGYMKGHYIASFIGMAPLDNPRVIALIIVDDPKGCIWGETVCGPIFGTTIEHTLRYLNAKPDVL
ncbi:MAG: penicillin-binding protein 2 [Candidatus Margulisiibacteriota bacterium]